MKDEACVLCVGVSSLKRPVNLQFCLIFPEIGQAKFYAHHMALRVAIFQIFKGQA